MEIDDVQQPKQLQTAINYEIGTAYSEYHSDYWQTVPRGGNYSQS